MGTDGQKEIDWEEVMDRRKGLVRASLVIMASGLLFFLIGVVISVFIFPPPPPDYKPDPRPSLVMYIGLATFVLGMFMYVWLYIIGEYGD